MHKDNETQSMQTETDELWQGIETESEVSAQELSKLAKRSKLKNKLFFAWDWLGCGIVAAVLYVAIAKQLSYLIVAWLVFGLIFSVWLTLQFNKFRVSGETALSGSTANYNQYLIDKAKADIKVGKLLNWSNWGLTASMFAVFLVEPFLPVEPLVSEPEKWLYIIAWSVFWIGLWLFYGYRKIRKGEQVLKQLQ